MIPRTGLLFTPPALPMIGRNKSRQVAFLTLAALSFYIAPKAAAAEFKTVGTEDYGVWEVRFQIAEDDGLGVCSMHAEWAKGFSFYLRSFYQSRVSLQLFHENWKIPTGTRRPIKLKVDDTFSTNILVEQVGPQSMGSIAFHTDNAYWPFIDAASKGRQLAIELPDGSKYNASLNKSNDALKRFTQCSNEWSGMKVAGRSLPTNTKPLPPVATTETPRPPTAPTRPTSKKSEDSDGSQTGSTGSGVIVSTAGHVVTNRHVVDKCGSIKVTKVSDLAVPAQVLAVSRTDDLALLKTPLSGAMASLLVGPGIKQGSNIHVYGFPLSGALAATGNFTSGSIAALAGLNNDSRFYQISAPVQPGNSGGPLIDASGNLIGLVTSKLNAITVAQYTGDIPQNINFALKGSVISNFLDAQGINYNTAQAGPDWRATDIAEAARGYSVHIACLK